MAELGTIHIMPIGVDVGHVKTAIREPRYWPIRKIYLIHSPDNSRDKLKQIAVKLKKDLEKSSDLQGKKFPVILRELSPTGAFEMEPVLNEIRKIESQEHGDELNPYQDMVVNVTGGTNIMAVASMWAAGSLKLDSYYVLREDLNPGLKSYLVPIATPKYNRFSVSANNPDHQQILDVLSKQTFDWEGIPETSKEPVEVGQSIKNSDWNAKETRKGVATLKDLLEIIGEPYMDKDGKKKYKVSPSTTQNRLDLMQADGLLDQKNNIPKHSVKGGKEYPRHEYFIDQRAVLVSISSMGKSALIGYKPTK